MIAPYHGDKPGDHLVNDALVHTYPPYIKSTDDRIKMIAFTDWHNYEPLDQAVCRRGFGRKRNR